MNLKIEKINIENLTIKDDCKIFEKKTIDHFTDIETNKSNMLKIQNKISSASDIEEISEQLQLTTRLMNFHLASKVNLKSLNLVGIDDVISIPVAITKKDKGRKSIYHLQKGESELTNIYVCNQGILLSYIEKISGSSKMAKINDEYKIKITNLKNEIAFEGKGVLEKFDKEKGSGKIVFRHNSTPQSEEKEKTVKVYARYSHLWSCFEGEVEVQVD